MNNANTLYKLNPIIECRTATTSRIINNLSTTTTIVTQLIEGDIEFLQNSCRLCLNYNQEISVFDNYQNSSVKISEIAEILANIKIDENDNLPKFICHECSLKLNLFYKFKQKCELSYCTLTALLGSVTDLNLPEKKKKDFRNRRNEIYVGENGNKILVIKEDNESINNESGDIDYLDPIAEEDKECINSDDDEIEKKIEQESHENSSVKDEMQTDEEFEFGVDEISASSNLENNEDQEKLTFFVDENEENTASIEIVPIKSEMSTNAESKLGKIHQCSVCKELFASRSSLTQHSLTHKSEKRFSCNICNNKFTRKHHVVLHMRVHNNLRPYTCKECSRSFIKSSDLLRHMRIHSDQKYFICEKCGKGFKRSTDLKSHMNTHTGMRPYSCKVCKKAYFSYSPMMKHCRKYKHL